MIQMLLEFVFGTGVLHGRKHPLFLKFDCKGTKKKEKRKTFLDFSCFFLFFCVPLHSII